MTDQESPSDYVPSQVLGFEREENVSTSLNSPVIQTQVPHQEEQQSHRTTVNDTSMDVDTMSQTVNEAFDAEIGETLLKVIPALT